MDDRVDENYVNAVLNLYKNKTVKNEEKKLETRNGFKQFILKDLEKNKITRETFNEVNERLLEIFEAEELELTKNGRLKEKIKAKSDIVNSKPINVHIINENNDSIIIEDEKKSKEIRKEDSFRRNIAVQQVKQIYSNNDITTVRDSSIKDEDHMLKEDCDFHNNSKRAESELKTDDVIGLIKKRNSIRKNGRNNAFREKIYVPQILISNSRMRKQTHGSETKKRKIVSPVISGRRTQLYTGELITDDIFRIVRERC